MGYRITVNTQTLFGHWQAIVTDGFPYSVMHVPSKRIISNHSTALEAIERAQWNKEDYDSMFDGQRL